MKQSLYRGLFACLSLSVLASCQDYDGGFSEELIKKAAYDKHFEQTFGTPDPNQDWSMATLVKANVNLPGLTGTAKMNICTGDPRNSSTRLLAQIMLKDGQGTIDFDAIKGADNVFVTVEQDGEYKVFSQYALQNGMLNIGDITPEMLLAAAPMTRAFTGSCPTTQGTATNRKDVEVDYGSDHEVFDCMKIRYPDTGSDERTLEQWIADTKAHVVDQYRNTDSYPFTNTSVQHFATLDGLDDTNSTFVLKSSASLNEEEFIGWTAWGSTTFKTLDGWKVFATGRGSNIENNHDDFPYEPSSIIVKDGYTFDHFDWTNPVLKDGASKYPVGSVLTYDGKSKLISDWKSELNTYISDFYYDRYISPYEKSSIKFLMTDCVSGTSGAIYLGLYPESHWELKSNAKEVPTYKTVKVKLQYLDNVETSPAPAWDAPLGYSFFGPGSFFAESVPYYTDGEKLNVYYDEAEMAEMEKGFCIKTTSTGPIELPYIFGCTDYSNQFGYIYWKDGDELKPDFNPYELKHFVLIEDARPASNIHKESPTGETITYNHFNTWDQNLSGNYLDGSELAQQAYDAAANHSYYGTTYRVMYFGDDYNNTTGTYDFPAGYRIAFFITTLATDTPADPSRTTLLKETHHPHGQGTRFNYSLPEFNEGLNHLNTKRPGGPKGMVKCIVWSHDGNTYMGFGDNSGDEDLNDIVFLVKGNFTPTTNIIKVAPIKWHLNYEGNHHDGTSGTAKDDDLYFQESKNVGGTYSKPNGEPVRSGYTFKGWAATPNGPVLSDASLTDVTVVDENGACYFAIWEPESDPGVEYVNIKWHKNYDQTHHDGTNGTSLDDDLHSSNKVVKSTGTYNKPADDPTRTGYVFLGWATEPDATEPNVFTGENPADLTAGESDVCYHALWEKLDDPVEDPEPITWILACEDLGGSFDYDFNDVVWSVQTSWSEGTPTTKVKVLAAGGTLGFALKYDGTQICTKSTAFTETTTDEQVVNAGSSNGVTRTPVEFTLGTPIEILSSNWTKFSVVVKDHGDSLHEVQNVKESTKNSKAPQIILLPEEWEWPTELTPIYEAYINFTTWVTDNTAATWGSWSDHKQNGKTVSRQ